MSEERVHAGNDEIITEAEDYKNYPEDKRYQPVNIQHLDFTDFHNLGCLDTKSKEYRWLNIGRTIDELNKLNEENQVLKKKLEYNDRYINQLLYKPKFYDVLPQAFEIMEVNNELNEENEELKKQIKELKKVEKLAFNKGLIGYKRR